MGIVDVTFGPSHCTWSNVGSDGAIAVSPDDAQLLVLTVPLTTGLLPLNLATLFAQIRLTWDAVAADGLKSSRRCDYPIAVCQGDPTPGSVKKHYEVFSAADDSPTSGSPALSVEVRDSSGLRADAPASLNAFVLPRLTINGNGDLELTLEGHSTDSFSNAGVIWSFSNLSAQYRIFGSV